MAQTDLDVLAERYRQEQGGRNWGNELPSGDAAKQSVYTNFMQLLGRPPTQEELNEYSLTGGGASGITAAVSALKHTPANDLKNERERLLVDAPKHHEDITGQFKSILGRDPTKEELDHFGSVMASGATDAYGLQSFLKSLPENVQKEDQAFRNTLSGQLQGYDKQYFQEQIMPSIQSNFAKQGRSVDSSGFANALAQAGGQQNQQRQQYLAQLSASQYGNNSANAYNQYAGNASNVQNIMYQSAVGPSKRLGEMADYTMQQNAYNDYLQRYGKRNGGGQGAIAGATAGATIGTSIMPGWGTAIGGIGGGLAGYFGSQGGY